MHHSAGVMITKFSRDIICIAGVSGAPSDNNIMLWNAVIFGPHDTPFEDGTFKLTIEFTEEYPNKPPTVR